jgi:hypothetical protein
MGIFREMDEEREREERELGNHVKEHLGTDDRDDDVDAFTATQEGKYERWR